MRSEQTIYNLKKKIHAISPHIFEGTPVLFAYLYGSYAKGLPHAFSDVDIGIFVEELSTKACLELELLLALQIDEQLDHEVQSEVRSMNHLPLVVKGRILTDGELIYSIAEDKRIDFESHVRMSYFDFLPVIEQHQKAYQGEMLTEYSS